MPRRRRLLARLRVRTADAPSARRVLLPAASFLRMEDRSGWPLLVASALALGWGPSLLAGLAGFAVLRWPPSRAGRGAGSPE